MRLERGPSYQRLVLYAIGLICFCVVMYMLGSPMTLWTMQFALDQTDTIVLEGFSLPTTVSDAIPAMVGSPSIETSPGTKREVNEDGLLRPPNTIV
jgi:hypothetical protein